MSVRVDGKGTVVEGCNWMESRSEVGCSMVQVDVGL